MTPWLWTTFIPVPKLHVLAQEIFCKCASEDGLSPFAQMGRGLDSVSAETSCLTPQQVSAWALCVTSGVSAGTGDSGILVHLRSGFLVDAGEEPWSLDWPVKQTQQAHIQANLKQNYSYHDLSLKPADDKPKSRHGSPVLSSVTAECSLGPAWFQDQLRDEDRGDLLPLTWSLQTWLNPLMPSSMFIRWPGCSLGSHAWILIAMFQLALDLPAWASGAPTDQQALLRRGKRHLQGPAFNSFDFLGSRPTTETEFIAWGPTGEEEALESNTFPGFYGPTTVSIFQTRKTTVATATTTATATTATSVTLQTQGVTEPLDPRSRIPVGVSTTEPSTSPSRDSGRDSQPPRVLGETSGLAVHQIITITVSLIMVIAALITTLVLKNCCAQSGNPRRNSHQRKTNHQEESCQNLTDFTPARVPSSLDIFTAYNETLQCSHECVRASVPVYTDETLHPAGEYKSTFNGNRPSSSDRHLIPVAFVSEKWFEISC
ncbi:hypothetical protein MJG53_011164 [Ovis ammon polii x Ovis aries]|uniref:Uncharacterized protein n=1 Tax=Ovis ammon polii x Ovis aries TaxID=2918886 RepID=A0ACB9URX1_9CETA|nr:hypothetical protein MJG53_011164 [Ovis ammon polii x Ovis aries]